MSIPALNAGLNGIHTGMSNMKRDAFAITQAAHSDNPVDVAGPLVNLKMDALQVQTSAKVVETVHELLGTLLDIKA